MTPSAHITIRKDEIDAEMVHADPTVAIVAANDTDDIRWILYEDDLTYRKFEGNYPVKLDHFTTVRTFLNLIV